MSRYRDISQYTEAVDDVVATGPDSIGETIRAVRQTDGIQQAELAERAGLHRSYVSKIERGGSMETMARVFRLLRALDLELVIRRRRR